MADTVDIVEFLTVRYDEEQQLAEAASSGPWKHHTWDLGSEHGVQDAEQRWVADGLREADAAYIAAHDPARVLADIAMKRRLLKLHFRMTLHGGGGGADWYNTTTVCGSCVPPRQFPETAWPCLTARAMVAPYADHPDFDPAWKGH